MEADRRNLIIKNLQMQVGVQAVTIAELSAIIEEQARAIREKEVEKDGDSSSK